MTRARFHLSPLIAAVALTGIALGGCSTGSWLSGNDVADSAAVAHNSSGIAYKNFPASAEDLRLAALRAVRRMDLTVIADSPLPNAHAIVAAASQRRVEIAVEPVAGGGSRMRVLANEGAALRKDTAAAAEIIIHTAASLDDIALRHELTQSAALPEG